MPCNWFMHRLTVEKSAVSRLPLGLSWGLFLSRPRAMSDTQEDNWVETIGKPCFENLAEMVAALNCDYERLEELREERDDWEPQESDTPGVNEHNSWAEENPDDAEELKELEEAAKPCGNECSSREDAEQMIQEDPLSVEVRSGWVTPGTEDMGGPEEFQILLSTGGPATRIMGELDANGEPSRAWLEVQDWFKPWTEYVPADSDVLLTYARCFMYTI